MWDGGNVCAAQNATQGAMDVPTASANPISFSPHPLSTVRKVTHLMWLRALHRK